MKKITLSKPCKKLNKELYFKNWHPNVYLQNVRTLSKNDFTLAEEQYIWSMKLTNNN